jgi:hypothetical protein
MTARAHQTAACHRSIATDGISYVPHGSDRAFTCDTLNRYWNDPAYRAEVAETTQRERDLHNTIIDCALIRAGTRWPAHWSDEEKAEATARLLNGKDIA